MSDSKSWYLDRLVAEQKRRVHQEWVRSSLHHQEPAVVLKTDLFEEANGADRILGDLFPKATLAVGIDVDAETARRALRRNPDAFLAMTCDVRHLALPSQSVDVVVSTSTLDHFTDARDIGSALDEINRVLRPGGILLITLDNPRNPLYHLLRWTSRRGWLPLQLGETLSLESLMAMLRDRGLLLRNTSYLIHNPRGISTAVFLLARRLLGRFADLPIHCLLRGFELLGRMPTKSITGCFAAVSAVKPECRIASDRAAGSPPAGVAVP